MARDRLRHLLDRTGASRSRRVVKVHGLLRTGTNYLSAVVGENLDVTVLGPENGGWKHGPIEPAPGVGVVVVVKSPFTWLESFYNWERIRQRTEAPTLTEFAEAPVSHPELARVWRAHDPVDAWNKATASWVAASAAGADAAGGDVVVVRYEDVIADLAGTLDRVTERIPARRRHRRPVDIEDRVGPGWKTVGPVDRDHYGTDGTDGAGQVDEDLVRAVRARLDLDLARSLRYAGDG